MKKNLLKCMFLLIAFMFLPYLKTEAAVVSKLSSANIVLEKNEKFVLKVIDSRKNVKWSTDSKKISLKPGRKKVTITALQPGRSVVYAKIGKRTLKCNIKISKVPFERRSPKVCVVFSQFKSVHWNTVPGADGYLISKKQKNGKFKVIKNVKNSSKYYYTDNSYKNDTYQVKAYRKVNGKTVYSKTVTQEITYE